MAPVFFGQDMVSVSGYDEYEERRQIGWRLDVLRLIALAIFAVLTLPASTHAIAAAAHRHGLKPVKMVSAPVPLELGTSDEEPFAA